MTAVGVPDPAEVEALAERDARLNTWLAGVKSGDIVTVRLNRTDTLTGKVYEAPDDSGRIALYVNTTLLRHGNGYPGGSFEPVLADHDRTRDRELGERIAAAITTHNGTPVSPENLRYAATHEALCRSWIFDVLTGLAGVLDRAESERARQHTGTGGE